MDTRPTTAKQQATGARRARFTAVISSTRLGVVPVTEAGLTNRDQPQYDSSRMGTRVRALIAVAGVAVLAGCGSTAASSTSGTASSDTGSGASATSNAATALRARLLGSNELAGFTAETKPIGGFTPQAWLTSIQIPPSHVAAEAAKLKQLGFVGGLSESLTNSHGGLQGVSMVEQFRSPSGAQSQLATQVREFKAAAPASDHYVAFPVSSIPTAQGFGISATGGAGLDVAFADGDYYYLLAESASAANQLDRSSLIAAAHHLYQRVHTQ